MLEHLPKKDQPGLLIRCQPLGFFFLCLHFSVQQLAHIQNVSLTSLTITSCWVQRTQSIFSSCPVGFFTRLTSLPLLPSTLQVPTLPPPTLRDFYCSISVSLYLSLDISSNFTCVSRFFLLGKGRWTCYMIPWNSVWFSFYNNYYHLLIYSNHKFLSLTLMM